MNGILSQIGNTPLIQLSNVFERNRFRVYMKMEAQNPSGSAKARSAYRIIEQAISRGEINKDTVIIESSSGNFGIALAQICCYLRLKFICIVDRKITRQNINILHSYGAKIECITKPDSETGEYLLARIKRVKKLLKEIPNSFWPNQYGNIDNPIAHRETMHEIDIALKGKVDYIYCAVSTFGTIRGFCEYVDMNQMSTKIIAVDAVGSILFGGNRGKRLVPGHGAAVVPALYQEGIVSKCIHVTDYDCVTGCRELLHKEAILTGGSTGGILSAIIKDQGNIADNATCVMIMHDQGERYIDTIYSNEWVTEHFGQVEEYIH